MVDPLVVQNMREFKRQLLQQEHAQMTAMATRWLQIEQVLDAEIAALAQEFDDRRANNQAVSDAALFRMGRYQSLMRQLERELEQYEDYATQAISEGQRTFGRMGIENAAQSISVQYPSGGGNFFDRLPVEAVENMVGLAGDGSPLNVLLHEGWGDAAGGLTQQLITNTALGRGPRETARLMKRGMSLGLNRMLNIARTEEMRVLRFASQQQYAASGVVSHHIRIATHDDAVCPACIAAEGEQLEVGEPVYDHPSGRCTSIPQVDGLPPVQFELGRDWLRGQDADTQRKILGRGRYDAWQEGRFDLDELVVIQDNAVWGKSLQPASLTSLQQ